MSFEDVDRKIKEALSKQNITFRTKEEERLANFTTLLTENAQKEAVEYEDAHIQRLVLLHEQKIKEGTPIYQIGNPDAPLPEGSYMSRHNQLVMKMENGQEVVISNPRVSGLQAHLTEAYQANGLEGLTEAVKNDASVNKPQTIRQGVSGGTSADDILRLQSELIDHVKTNQLSGVISHGPSLDDIKAAIANKGAQPSTESVSLSRRTLSKIIEGSDLAAKIMRSKVL